MKKLILIFLMVILSSSVLGISLSSSLLKTNPIMFEPGLTFSKDYLISKFKYPAAPYVNGDLAEYVSLEILENTSDHISFRAIFAFPEEIETAGLHIILIGAKEIAPPGGGIVALTRAQKKVKIMVLYQEKVVDIKDFSTPNVNENEVTDFSFTAESLTKQDVFGINGQIDIFNFDKQLVRTLEVERFDIKSAETKRINTEFDSTSFIPGQYSAKAIINWENETTILESTFNVGTLQLDILNYTTNFTAGQINKITINIESQWKGLIKDVFAQLFIDNEEQATTQTYNIASFEKKEMIGYLDLTFVEAGEHELKIVLNFEGEQKTIVDPIVVIGKARQKPISITFNTIEIMMILVIIALALIVVIMVRQEKKTK